MKGVWWINAHHFGIFENVGGRQQALDKPKFKAIVSQVMEHTGLRNGTYGGKPFCIVEVKLVIGHRLKKNKKKHWYRDHVQVALILSMLTNEGASWIHLKKIWQMTFMIVQYTHTHTVWSFASHDDELPEYSHRGPDWPPWFLIAGYRWARALGSRTTYYMDTNSHSTAWRWL